MLNQDHLYHDATLFDQLGTWTRQQLQQRLPANTHHRWGLGFYLFGLLLGAAAMILVLRIANIELSGNAVLAHLIAAGLMFASGQYFMQSGRGALRPAARNRATAAPAKPLHPAPQPAEPAASAPTSQAFLAEIRAAGVNVRIARALYTAGVRSPALLIGATDDQLLAIRGVGPATVRKLRQHFSGN